MKKYTKIILMVFCLNMIVAFSNANAVTFKFPADNQKWTANGFREMTIRTDPNTGEEWCAGIPITGNYSSTSAPWGTYNGDGALYLDLDQVTMDYNTPTADGEPCPQYGTENELVYYEFKSPDIENDPNWQNIAVSGFSVDIWTGEKFYGQSEVKVAFFVRYNVYDESGNVIEIGYRESTFTKMVEGPATYTYSKSSFGLAKNAVITNLGVRFYFQEDSRYNGFIYIDNVIPGYSFVNPLILEKLENMTVEKYSY